MCRETEFGQPGQSLIHAEDACGACRVCRVFVELVHGSIALFVVTSWTPGRTEMNCLVFLGSLKCFCAWVIDDISPRLDDFMNDAADLQTLSNICCCQLSGLTCWFSHLLVASQLVSHHSSRGTIICFLTLHTGLCGASSPTMCLLQQFAADQSLHCLPPPPPPPHLTYLVSLPH